MGEKIPSPNSASGKNTLFIIRKRFDRSLRHLVVEKIAAALKCQWPDMSNFQKKTKSVEKEATLITFITTDAIAASLNGSGKAPASIFSCSFKSAECAAKPPTYNKKLRQ